MPDGPKQTWSDSELVLGVRRGDRECFDVLVHRHQREVRAVARSICADLEESQDVAQEAFIRAWTNLDLLVDPSRFGAWIRRIAFACAIDGLRRRVPAPRADLEALLAHLPSTETHADAALAAHQLTVAVRAAVARLPPRYRRPLVLYHLDGLRHERIATVLRVAPGTVRSLVTRARQALRADLVRFSQETAMTQPRPVHPSAPYIVDELLRDPAPRSILHICNGWGTSRPLEQSGVPGAFKLFSDVLLEGPCPPLWGEKWRELRVKFLIEVGYASPSQEAGEGPPGRARGPDVQEDAEIIWDSAFERALSSTEQLHEVVLWYEHDLFDQLLLIRLLALVARHEGERPGLSLISIGEHPEVPKFEGLGQLSPDQLASLFETRAFIDEECIALGRDAWEAFSNPDPRMLETLLERDLSALPFLTRALRRHLEEFPGVDDGLSRTERNLLTLVQDGVADATRAWWKLREAEDCHYIADGWFIRLIQRLSAAPAALLAADGQLRMPLELGQATLSLTPLGEKVLRGRADWLSFSGIDRWLGGAHLTDAQTAWRWDPTTRRLCRRVQPST